MATPIYVGNAKKHGKFADTISIGFNREHLKTLADNLNEGGWVNLLVSPQRANKDKFSVKIDDWQPRSADRAEEHAEAERQGFQPDEPIEPVKNDGLPF